MEGIMYYGAPTQRRLTRMYTDTKSSLEFVSKPAQDEDEELRKLHRKLRIQKDRLTTWGLRWSETAENTSVPVSTNDDIDESLSRAGLADVVGSIMETIKDILAEAEPLWQASAARNNGFSSRTAEKAAEAKVPLMQWDKSRFEDLVKDLTSSIDTLYDISRMRHGKPRRAKSKKNIELVVRQERTFEKSRMDAPQVIDPKRLKDLNGECVVSVKDDGSESLKVEGGKRILCLESDSSDERTFGRETPVLVEIVTYDSLYSFTGIGPPMARFEKLFHALQRDDNGPDKADFGSLRLIGYFEESRNSRFAMVYELPERAKFGRQWGMGKSQFPVPYYARLADVVSHRSLEPPLEVKYRLAYNLATGVFDLHSRGVVHGNIALSNVTFFESHARKSQEEERLSCPLSDNDRILLDLGSEEPRTDWKQSAEEFNRRTGQQKKVPALQMMYTRTLEKKRGWEQRIEEAPETTTDDWLTCVNLRRPYLTSYDLFPEPASSDGPSWKEPADITWYRHRLDPRLTARSPFTMESQQLDLYALALLLVEIGLWQSSKEMQHGITVNSTVMNVKEDPASVCKLLAARCGTSYKNAFQACFEAMGSKNRANHSRSGRTNVDLQKVYGRVLSCLERCCSIEEDEDTADTPDDGNDSPSASLAKVSQGFNNAEPWKQESWHDSDSRREAAEGPAVRDRFVSVERDQKPEKNIPYREQLLERHSQALAISEETKAPLQPQTRCRWVSRNMRRGYVAPDDTSQEGMTKHQMLLPPDELSISPPVGETPFSVRSLPQSPFSSRDVADTADDDKATTFSGVDYEDSLFSGDDCRSNPTTMSRRTSTSRRTKASRSHTIPADGEVTPVDPAEEDAKDVPTRRTRVRFEDPSPWKTRSPDSKAYRDEAKVAPVSSASLRDILRKPMVSCLILDLREPSLYAYSRIRGALNVCVPASQLAQPSFDLAKLAATFKNAEEGVQLLRWQEYEYIFVYDTEHRKEEHTTFDVIMKFTSAGWTGRAGILQGGFEAFVQVTDDLVDQSSQSIEAVDDSEQANSDVSGKAAVMSIEEIEREIERVQKHVDERTQRRMAAMHLSKEEEHKSKYPAPKSINTSEHAPQADLTREATEENTENATSNESIEMDNREESEAGPKAKARRFPAMQIMQEHLDTWHKSLMPQINEALRSFYRKHPESVEISLESIGESPQKAKPTILVICTSVGKVKSVLKRHFDYDAATYGLMVCKGKIVRSGARKRRPRRSMLHGEDSYYEAKNIQHQRRPLNGASIGAHCEGRALPAVSFGGMVMVDGEPFGMSVHHMLDVGSDDEYDYEDESSIPTIRSSETKSYAVQAPFVQDAPESGYEFSEHDSDTASVISSEYDSGSESGSEPGDIPGIAPEDCEEGYLITQPAFDDIDDDYFRKTDHMDEYLDNYTVGRLHASSGLRRRYHGPGLPHEIDWALFRFNEDRMPTGNHIIGASTYCSTKTEYPTSCVPYDQLARLEVHAIGRTTGLTGGYILEARASIKMKGRLTPAQSYMITGGLGVPGDSGAWVMDNEKGRACGHVLAWSDKKQVAYFSPMEVMLEDIKETLDAEAVDFPKSKVGSGRRVLEEEYLTVDNSLEELTRRLALHSVDINDRPYAGRIQTQRPVTPPAGVQAQRKASISDLDIVSGMDGMCLSGGLLLQSSAL